MSQDCVKLFPQGTTNHKLLQKKQRAVLGNFIAVTLLLVVNAVIPWITMVFDYRADTVPNKMLINVPCKQLPRILFNHNRAVQMWIYQDVTIALTYRGTIYRTNRHSNVPFIFEHIIKIPHGLNRTTRRGIHDTLAGVGFRDVVF